MSRSGGAPQQTYGTRAHENTYRNPGRRAAREAFLAARERRRQEAVASAVVFWDPGAA